MNYLHLLNPSCWLRNYKTNKTWDRRLNIILDNNPRIQRLGAFSILLNDKYKVWVENYPYAYGSRYYGIYPYEGNSILPSRVTVIRLKEIMDDFDRIESKL